jgi:hypothetical protein
VGLADFTKEPRWRVPSLLLETDPPEHDRTRAVVSRVLSPAAMRLLRDEFAREAEAMVDAAVEKGSFDAITELAEEFPLTAFPRALGLRDVRRDYLMHFAAQSFNSVGPKNELWRQAMEGAEVVRAWAMEQCQRGNLAPGGFGAQIHDAVASGEITEEEAPILVRSLLSAGMDTTINGLGGALWCLARFPDQFQILRRNPDLARAAFEEAVRFESPVQTFFRTTKKPGRIGDVLLDEGQKVIMFLGAANRDPRKWPDADRYDIERKTVGHVGFGAGIHQCVGQLVARLEGEVLLAALARKVAAIEITGAPVRRYNNTLRGLASLPVRVVAA